MHDKPSPANNIAYVGVELLKPVNDDGSKTLVAVASAAGTWTDSALHQPG